MLWRSRSLCEVVLVADKRCRNGHFIDESWDICPYCPPDSMYQHSDSEPARPQQAEPPAISYDHPPATRPAPPPAEQPVPEGHPPQRTVAAAKLDLDQRRYVVGWLVGLNGKARGEACPVRMGRNILGRSRESEIVIQDDQASAHHADLIYRPEERRYILMDHNSTNGTYVNGKEIEPRRDLVSRDIVTIGSHRFLFVSLSELGLDWDDHGELR